MTSSASVLVDGAADPEAPAPVRKPKRVLHFPDGILEEYSDEETFHDPDDDVAKDKPQCTATVPTKSPKHMRWGEYLLHVTMTFGVKSLNFCDYMGEKFAWVLGITTPKYAYAIEERDRQKKEDAEEEAREERERAAKAKRNAVAPNQSDLGGATPAWPTSNGVHLNNENDILDSEKRKY